jgi:hypothetical protein
MIISAWVGPALRGPGSRTALALIGLVSLFMYVFGLICAVSALCQAPRVGRRGVLAPAIIGLVLNLAILSLIALLLLRFR